MTTLDPSSFPSLSTDQVAELQATVDRMERANERREARRRGRERKRAIILPADQALPYPPDPFWGTDDRGRFRYVDYDGESLHIRFEEDGDGDLWIDKQGEGPVYVRGEDMPVIVAALKGD